MFRRTRQRCLKTIYWKEVPIVSFDEEEIIIEESLCKKEVEDGSLKVDVKPPGGEFSESQEVVLTTEKGDIYYTLNGSDPSTNGTKYVNPIRIGFDGQTILKFVVLSENSNSEVFTEIYNIDQSITTPELPTVRDELGLTLNIPKGKVSDLMGLLNFIQMKFEDLEIQIRASKGSITEEEYENRILEAIRQIKFK